MACDPNQQITQEDLTLFKQNIEAENQHVNSSADTFQKPGGGTGITQTGIENAAAQQRDEIQQLANEAISAVDGVDIGVWTSGVTTYNNYNEYATFDRSGTIERWYLRPSIPLGYTAATTDPINETNFVYPAGLITEQAVDNKDNARQKEITGLSQITEAVSGDDIFPLIGQGIRVEGVGLWVVPSVTADGSPLPNPATLDATPTSSNVTVNGGTAVTLSDASDTVVKDVYALNDIEVKIGGTVRTGGTTWRKVLAANELASYTPLTKVCMNDFITANGLIDDSDGYELCLSLGYSCYLRSDSMVRLDRAIVTTDVNIDFDLGGAQVISFNQTDIRFQHYYPYDAPIDITSIDLANRQYTVTDASSLTEGQRVKVASNDRSQYNRPAPGDGRDYWQAQTFTILDITGNVVTMEQYTESDFTFATTPKLVAYNKKRCHIYNGTIQANEGSPATDVNGLLRIFGGTNHVLEKLTSNLSAWTAFGFSGCDNPTVSICEIRNVGRDDDTSGNHGVDFISCESPLLTDSLGGNCRHFVTNNSTPTQWADQDYYLIGDSFDMQVCDNTADSDRNNPFDTHHGLRRGKFTNNIARDSATGFAARGVGVRFVNNDVERCGRAYQLWTEAGVASIDRSRDMYIGVSRNKDLQPEYARPGTTPSDIRIQNVALVTIGEVTTSSNISRGLYATDSGLRFTGPYYSQTQAAFNNNGSFWEFNDCDVQVNGNIRLDTTQMTIDGANNAILLTGASNFKVNATLDVNVPTVGALNRVILHSGSGNFDLDLLKFDGSLTNPVGFGSTNARQKWERDDGGNSGYIQFTASASYDLAFRNTKDKTVTVNIALAGLSSTLNSIADATVDGQRLIIYTQGSGDLTLDSGIANLNLTGGNIVMSNNDNYSFFWTGAEWFIEDRKGA